MGQRVEIIKMWLFIWKSAGGHGDEPSDEERGSEQILLRARNSGKSQLRMQGTAEHLQEPFTHAANAEEGRKH